MRTLLLDRYTILLLAEKTREGEGACFYDFIVILSLVSVLSYLLSRIKRVAVGASADGT